MVTPEEVSARLAKAREPIKKMEETEETPVEDTPVEDSPVEDDGKETSDEEGSVIDEEKTED